MMQMPNIADPNTYKLLTPGPLTTTLAVREAMLVDRCTWDDDYKAMTESIRASLLELAEANPAEYGVVLMQGSGTFGVESVLSSVPGAADRVLVLVNGAYSERMCQILTYHRIPFDRIDCGWDETPDAQRVAEWLDAHPETTMVSMVQRNDDGYSQRHRKCGPRRKGEKSLVHRGCHEQLRRGGNPGGVSRH